MGNPGQRQADVTQWHIWHSMCLCRLKAELASLSESGGKSKGGGKGEFEKILQALTSRIAQWAQLEKASEEVSWFGSVMRFSYGVQLEEQG